MCASVIYAGLVGCRECEEQVRSTHLFFLRVSLNRWHALRISEYALLHPSHNGHNQRTAAYNSAHEQLQRVPPEVRACDVKR